ncbi:hypothetical protein VY86_02540 [Photorhabdus thracensis]|uniref:Uncharacterized protein n=1 Tax=Photorhabdus thracensis TaxID=230089 RepID=A0A0F7LKI0_9GAMM|nr:hypothetical protein VY86_02540 [Photorhabdus thracensis]
MFNPFISDSIFHLFYIYLIFHNYLKSANKEALEGEIPVYEYIQAIEKRRRKAGRPVYFRLEVF